MVIAISLKKRLGEDLVQNHSTKRSRRYEAKQQWQISNMAISHRIGKLSVGEINLVIAVASAHRNEGFNACQYAVDQFKQRLPTKKKETCQDGSANKRV